MRTLLLALISVAPLLRADSSVWKVTRGGNTVYLGGTIHLLRPADLPLPPEFDAAFAATGPVYFETDLARVQSAEMQRIVAERGMFTDSTTLDQVLSADAWKAARDYATRAGIPLEQLKQLKPWLFVVLVSATELRKMGITADGVDVHYERLARGAGRPCGELESFEQHIDYIVGLGAGHESEMVKSSLEELAEIPTVMNKVLAAWRSGDLATLDQLMVADLKTDYPAIYQALLVSRNALWLPKIETLLKSPESEFVLVGAAHLAGPDGLVAQLRARGCRVEQLKLPQPSMPSSRK